MNVGQTTVQVLYDGKNISEDISAHVLSVTYTDNVKGKADEVEIKLEDSSGLFQNSWYPDKGSRLTVEIFHDGQSLPCGVFSIDEVSISGPPDVVSWRGVSAFITNAMRTKNSRGYENTTLLKIAQDIAALHGLTVDDGTKTVTRKLKPTTEEQAKLVKLADFAFKTGSERDLSFLYPKVSALMNQVYPIIKSLLEKGYDEEANFLRTASQALQINMTRDNCFVFSKFVSQIKSKLYDDPAIRTTVLGLGLSKIKITRSTQNRETDLAYLERLAAQYGLAFNIKPPLMVFYSLFNLKDAPSALKIDKSQIVSFDFTDKTSGTYSGVDVQSHNPGTNKTIKAGPTYKDASYARDLLGVLFVQASHAGSLIPTDQRSTAIQSLSTFTMRSLAALKTAGFNGYVKQMENAYANLLIERSQEACVRYANYVKKLQTDLYSLNTTGYTQDQYSGGQSANTLRIRAKVENKEQADAVGKAALLATNSKTRTGKISTPGQILAIAGNNFEATGFGQLSGKYNIVTSTHTVDKSNGYTTDVDFQIGPITAKQSTGGATPKNTNTGQIDGEDDNDGPSFRGAGSGGNF